MIPFVIVAQPRTGSSLLQQSLDQHPHIKTYAELFHNLKNQRMGGHAIQREGKTIYWDEHEDAVEFLRREVYGYNEGWKAIGFKLFGNNVDQPGTFNIYQRIKAAFPDLKVIHLVRHNYFEVLVSWEIAYERRFWINVVKLPEWPPIPRFNIPPEKAEKFFAAQEKAEREASEVFSGPSCQLDFHHASAAQNPRLVDKKQSGCPG